jgi:hypothetical protein
MELIQNEKGLALSVLIQHEKWLVLRQVELIQHEKGLALRTNGKSHPALKRVGTETWVHMIRYGCITGKWMF